MLTRYPVKNAKLLGLLAVASVAIILVIWVGTTHNSDNKKALRTDPVISMIANVFDSATSNPTIKTDSGLIQGLENKTYTGVQYWKFLGVPFAEPPVGKMRFLNAIPVRPWSDTLQAFAEKEQCMQLEWGTKSFSGTHDCLGINIAIPRLPNPKKTNLLPVMVWIHGGAFTSGSGSLNEFNPDNFLNRGIIVCSIQYRLGIYGFLSFDDPAAKTPGNVGLKDQILALQWIKENILNFGGNPNKITIFGESAGGASTHLLSLSPKDNGLFDQVISESGLGLFMWAISKRPLKYLPVAERLGCSTKTQLAIYECFENKTDTEILAAVGDFSATDPDFLGLSIAFGPVIEPYETENSFLLESPEEVIRNKHFLPRPYIMGYTSNDGGLGLPPLGNLPLNFTEESYERVIIDDVQVERNTDESKKLAQRIVTFYYGDKKPSEQNLYEYLNLETDYHFLVKLYRTVRLYKMLSSASTYVYKFNFIDPYSYWNRNHPDRTIVSHGDELTFLFHRRDSVNVNQTDFTKGENLMSDLWSSFAKTGKPSSSIVDFDWRPIGISNFNMVIQPNAYMAEEIEEKDRMNFWDSVYREYNGDDF